MKLSMAEANVPSAQYWLRHYSQLLAASFESLSVIKHAVTKGDSRDYQILDILSKLLPGRAAVERGAIMDSNGTQAPQTDGAIFAGDEWPRFYADNGNTVLMLESMP